MAITLNDLKERLKHADEDIKDMNFGNAHKRLLQIINILEHSGIAIHALATIETKKVDGNDSQEN